jgi:O-acetyl-ADP-ribose deacetylase (regulator of RNase III)
MVRATEAIPVENVRRATRAALDLAEKEQIPCLGFPGMGTGVGRVSPDAAAKEMITEMTSFQGKSVQKIILVDVSRAMVSAWKEVSKKSKLGEKN